MDVLFIQNRDLIVALLHLYPTTLCARLLAWFIHCLKRNCWQIIHTSISSLQSYSKGFGLSCGQIEIGENSIISNIAIVVLAYLIVGAAIKNTLVINFPTRWEYLYQSQIGECLRWTIANSNYSCEFFSLF